MTRQEPVSTSPLQQLALEVLERQCEAVRTGEYSSADGDLASELAPLLAQPALPDARLVALARRLGLPDGEIMAVALCLAADADPQSARIVARAQEPLGTSRPLVGLIAALFAPLGLSSITLAGGRAVETGLLTLGDEPRALPERSVTVATPTAAVLAGEMALPPGVSRIASRPVAFTDAQRTTLGDEARWLAAGDGPRLLVVRTPSRREATATAQEIAEKLGREPVVVGYEALAANAAWLMAADALPCIELSLGPGENRQIPQAGCYDGPVLCLMGRDGACDGGMNQRELVLTLPGEAERQALWRKAGLDENAAQLAARTYRQGAGRIAELSEQARNASFDGTLDWKGVSAQVRRGRSALDGLAHPICAEIAREELVLPPNSLAELDLLLGRVLHRADLATGLGAAIAPRYGPGVKALFAGEPGTGKTLAAHWLAGQTGLPLYRVDLASLTSKWIGETEKNLSAILDAAQHADVMLFFDEADALFGKRTEVSDAHDRYANAQTNYLLQRIEDFEGIVILATNVRDNMDAAFARRLDAIVQFPMPDAPARFELWQKHLGTDHGLTERELGALAVAVEMTGGHIRNIVLGAAVRARLAKTTVGMTELRSALADEYGKLGRAPPTIAP